jgi:hypothetical protein
MLLVNVTDCPSHTFGVGVLIFTVGVTTELTVIVITLEKTCVGVAQLAFDVNLHLTVCPFVRELVVKVELVAPLTLTPFTCH